MSFSYLVDRSKLFADAIKKILLEPERGKLAKYGANQNKKLRREVTTISRMTHKNIVRYYQAWVEGGPNDGTNDDTIREEEDDVHNNDDEPELIPSSEEQQKPDVDDDDDDDDDDDGDQGGSWWVNSPDDRGDLPIHKMLNDNPSSSSSSGSDSGESSSSSSWSNEGDGGGDSSDPFGTTNELDGTKNSKQSASMVDLLEHENDFGLQVWQLCNLSLALGCSRLQRVLRP